MLIPIADLVRDEEIYPRRHLNQRTIDLYAERLKEGVLFPSIEIQRVSLDGKVELLIIDGVHRVEAHRRNDIGEIDCYFWREDKVFDKNDIDDWIELKIHSGEVNGAHGDRLDEPDTKRLARDVIEKNPKYSEAQLAKRLGISQQTVSSWVGDIKRRYEASQDNIIFRLHLLGWTQAEIGKAKGVRLVQSIVSERLSELPKLVKTIKDSFAKKKPVAEIAEYHNIDETLAWALILEGKNDLERFALFGKSEYGDDQPKLSDYWKFSQRDPRLGLEKYPGKLYGQEVLNIIYRYTKQGDLVVDPMAGGGVTVDACLIMSRRCRAYDIRPENSGRSEIIPHDAREGLPHRAKRCHLIFLDPPYYKKKEEEYGSSEFSKDRETFIANIAKLAEASYKAFLPGGYVALLYGQYINYEKELESILSSDLCQLFEKDNKFRPVLRIQSPLTFDIQYEPFEVERAKSFTPWRILPVSKDWQIFKKV